jgi:hypothetical protein
MRRLLLLALLLPLPSPLAAQEATSAPACQAMDATLPAELAAWRSPSPVAGPLRPGMAVTLALRPVSELQPAVQPHNAREDGVTTGARLDLEVAAAGTYRIAIDHGAWVDLVADGQPLRPVANGRGPACSTIHRILDFALNPGRYVIQLSGTTAATARLLVVPR